MLSLPVLRTRFHGLFLNREHSPAETELIQQGFRRSSSPDTLKLCDQMHHGQTQTLHHSTLGNLQELLTCKTCKDSTHYEWNLGQKLARFSCYSCGHVYNVERRRPEIASCKYFELTSDRELFLYGRPPGSKKMQPA